MNTHIQRKKIGIIGGGQLGKMMILDAKRMGFHITILDPTPNCPAHSIADKHIIKDFNDEKGIEELVAQCDVITYEFEHIATKSLMKLENNGHCIYPSPTVLNIIQDKYKQKVFLSEKGLSVPRFYQVESLDKLYKLCSCLNYPVMLKTCKGGYDGKGNAVIKDFENIEIAYKALGGGTLPLMVEEFIPYIKEISIMVCRSADGSTSVFPIAENIHVNSILQETSVPANINEELRQKVKEMAFQVIESFDTYGIFCIEMFLTDHDELYINEIAPRPHNSGHYTIEGCLTSQFAQHIRAILGLPMGNTELLQPTVMINLLGNEEGTAVYDGLYDALAIDQVNVHLYGKEEVMIGRKMGHITACHKTLEGAREKAYLAKSYIKILGR